MVLPLDEVLHHRAAGLGEAGDHAAPVARLRSGCVAVGLCGGLSGERQGLPRSRLVLMGHPEGGEQDEHARGRRAPLLHPLRAWRAARLLRQNTSAFGNLNFFVWCSTRAIEEADVSKRYDLCIVTQLVPSQVAIYEAPLQRYSTAIAALSARAIAPREDAKRYVLHLGHH